MGLDIYTGVCPCPTGVKQKVIYYNRCILVSAFQRAAENFFLSFPDAKILPCGSETKEETTQVFSSFFHAGRQ